MANPIENALSPSLPAHRPTTASNKAPPNAAIPLARKVDMNGAILLIGEAKGAQSLMSVEAAEKSDFKS